MRFYFCPYTHRARLVAAASCIIYIYKDHRRPPAANGWDECRRRRRRRRRCCYRRRVCDRHFPRFRRRPTPAPQPPPLHTTTAAVVRRRPCDINRSSPLTDVLLYRGLGFCFIPPHDLMRSACTELYVSTRRVRGRADVFGGARVDTLHVAYYLPLSRPSS